MSRSPFDLDPRRQFTVPRPPRGFWLLGAVIVVAVVLAFLVGPSISFSTELEWFRALGLDSVYLAMVRLQLGLFAAGFVVGAVFVMVNAIVALRLHSGPSLSVFGARPQRLPFGMRAASALSLVVGVFTGGALASGWQDFALYLHRHSMSVTDPIFHLDVSFYVFQLTFLHGLVDTALVLTVLVAIGAAVVHAFRGGVFNLRLGHAGLAHVSLLLALSAVWVGLDAYLGRYDLLHGHNGFVYGAGYTDVYARLPIANISVGLAAVLAVLLVANLVLRRIWLPVVALAAWVVLSVGGQFYAGTIERFAVQPNQFNQEQQFIAHELEFTRRGFNLDNVTASKYAGDAALTAKDVQDDRTTIDNLRLWDYRQLKDTYPQLQAIRTYYTFNDIDLDRYKIDGRYQQLELSARELDTSKLPTTSRGFVNEKLVYTHGYGAVASPVNAVVGEGLPDFVARDIPPSGPLKITQPGIYFGETTNNWVLAPSAQKELDFPQGGGDAYTNYTGTHGVRMTGVQRALWALRTGDLNLLISNQITPQTEILYRRSILDRVNAIAPYLTYDQDPYVVVADGKLYWMLDAYTTSSTYPYSREECPDQLQGNCINYIRNSVKVVIDAYEGTPQFYIADASDPVIAAWQDTFPALYHPLAEMPDSLKPHIRYPLFIFSVQSSVYQLYHMRDPQVFYNKEDAWALPVEQTGPDATTALEPYYVLMRLPDEKSPEYLLILPFTPRNRPNMISWLAARNDGADYGKLVLYQLPSDKVIYGPQQIGNRIQVNPQISAQFTLWNQSGSQVQQGNLLVVPVGGSFLYFEPIYLRSTGASAFPELKKVILADSQHVVWDDTLEGAIAQLVGSSGGSVMPTPSPSGSPGPGTGTPGSCLQTEAQQAGQHYQAAQDRLKAGDLAGYAAEVQKVGDLLNQMQSASPTSPCSAPASPSPSPAP